MDCSSGEDGKANQSIKDDILQRDDKVESGPRTIQLQKCENGYGFTLRYFVVYPPGSVKDDSGIEDSNKKDPAEDRPAQQMGSEPQSLEAMDTIFIKSVKEGSEADKAGLAQGDRIVSVNGNPVTGKSYGDVVKLIQDSEDNLQLLVVPKEDDILQLYFSGSAYHQSPSSTLEKNSNVSSQEYVNSHASSSTSNLTYHEPAFSQARTGSLNLQNDVELRSNSSDKFSSYRNISSANSRSLPSNYYSQAENINTNLSSSNLPAYGKLSYRPCPPPYGYHASKYSAVPARHGNVQSISGPPSLDSALSNNKENVIRTSESQSRSLSDDQLPSDIAYQHQSLVNRRKEEFLGNVSGLQNPQLTQSWSFGMNKKKPLPNTDSSKLLQPDASEQVEEKLGSKGSPNSNIFSEPVSSTSLPAWNTESSMMQSWPAIGHHQNESFSQSTQNPSLELANIQTSISNSQQSLCCNDENNTRNNAMKLNQNPMTSYVKLNNTTPVTTSSVSQGDDQNLKYGRSFVTTLSKIQENLSSNAALSSHSLDLSDQETTPKYPLKKANSFDYEAIPSENANTSQDILNQVDNDKVAQLQLVSQRAKQFETGSQMWEVEANNKRNLYKNELARISSRCKTPRVVERTAKYENMSAASSQETISNDADPATPRSRTSAEIEAKFCHHLAKMGILTPTVVEATSLSSPQTSKSDQNSQVISATPTSSHGSREGRISDREHYRNEHLKKARAMRQNSYLNAVCRDPKYSNGGHKINMVSNASETQSPPTYPNSVRHNYHQHQQIPYPEASTPLLRHQNSIKRSASMSECTFNRQHNMAVRLNSNRSSTTGHDLMKDSELFGSEFENLLDDGAISNLIAAFDSMLSGITGSGSPTNSSGQSAQTSPIRGTSATGVVLRKKQLYESTNDDGRGGVRRVSYLKATSSDGSDQINKRAGHIETTNTNHTEEVKPSTPRSHIHSIQKLKSFFGERTPQIVEASEKAQQHQLPSPTREALPSIPQDIVKEGLLNSKATLVDGKRASDRSWKPVWAVLRGHALYFYKDKKDANHSPSALSEEHAPINVKSCIVDIAYDYTKKKNVFRLTTFGASEFLFQADDNNDMLFWIQAIQENSNPDDDQKGIGNQNLILRKSSAVSSEHHQLSVKDQVARLSPQSTQKAKSSRKAAQSEESSPKSKTWRGKMVKSLRKFHGASSTPVLPQTEGTIGILLEDCPVAVSNEFIPLLVELCTKIVEAKGLEVVGIYRIPGNNASVAALQDAVNKGFENLNLQDSRWSDVNVISSLLKAFFRQLPEPLFTGELYPLFIEANKLEDNNQRMITLKKLVHELPDYHFETLQHLMFHLKKVVNYSDINKMEARNLAIVFGPNLVRTADNNMVTMVTDMSHQCKIVETVISNVDWFFSVDDNESNQPPTSSLEAVEQTSSNTNLLLGNIQRVEGMSGGHHGEVNTKDIVTNIISAANRRVKVKTSKKDFDERDIDREIEMRHQKLRRGSAPSESLSAKSGGKAYLTDWIKSDGVDSTNSTLSSSSRTLSSQTLSEDAISYQSTDTKPSNESLDRDKDIKNSNINNNLSKIPSSEHSNKNISSSRDLGSVKDRYVPSSSPKLISNDKNPPYTTLSPSTQERIKRFEAETKAFLQRDLHTRRSRHDSERHRHELERQRIELEWQRAKRDLEQEDFLDELADNPSDITRKISDFADKISDLNTKPDISTQPSIKTTDNSDYHRLGASTMLIKHPSNQQSLDGHSTKSNQHKIKLQNQQKSYLPPICSDGKRVPLSRTRGKVFTESSLRRGKSADNFINLEANIPASECPNKANLSFKHGGSLDSLRENYEPKDNSILNNSTSDDGDLLTSITSTLDSKLQVISSLGNRKFTPHSSSSSKSAVPLPPLKESHLDYRDPSLYRSRPPLSNGTNSVTSKEMQQPSPPIYRNIYRDPSMHRQNRPNNRKGIVGNEHFLLHFDNEESLPALALQGNLEEKFKPVAKPIVEGEKPFRQEFTTMRATISPRKNSITMSPTSTAIVNLTCKEKKSEEPRFLLKKSSSRDDLNNNKCFKKQKCGSTRMPLKRRHTVAGIQDFDKFKWLLSNENSRFSKEPRLSAWEQLRPVENLPPEQRSLKSWMMRERLRTSSPDLFHLKPSSSGDCLSVFQIDMNRKRNFPQPSPALESLV